ncbi:MAG: AbrB/MazE/SpoVT family DNA-binding domain-containing protein [Patescibacteria group bacterium]|nr:AbrB/MazE/SpoVT family DNA-binding domain-containing protein [Patescibacteria group bacterium]
MVQKIIKTGNSLAVTIPSVFAKSLGVKAGDAVKVEVEPEAGRLTCSFSGVKQLSLAGVIFRKKHL